MRKPLQIFLNVGFFVADEILGDQPDQLTAFQIGIQRVAGNQLVIFVEQLNQDAVLLDLFML